MSIDESDLVHIRRGSLLLDIGKLGVPDKILLKNGPLNDVEIEKIRQHPLIAYRYRFTSQRFATIENIQNYKF